MCRRILGFFFLLVVLAIAGVVYLAFYSPIPPHARAKIGKVQQAKAERRVEEALAHPVPASLPLTASRHSARQRAHLVAYRPSPDAQLSVRLAQGDINTILASNPAVLARLRRAKVDNATVAFAAPDKVVLTALVPLNGRERQVALSGTLAPTADGDVALHASGVQVGMLPVPVSSNAALDARAARLLALAMPKLPINVRSLTISNGVLILTGSRR